MHSKEGVPALHTQAGREGHGPSDNPVLKNILEEIWLLPALSSQQPLGWAVA